MSRCITIDRQIAHFYKPLYVKHNTIHIALNTNNMKELFTFVGFRQGQQVLTLVDVSLTDREAYSMYLKLSSTYKLDDCEYFS